MPANFDLIITADTPTGRVELELRDEHGAQLAYRATEFKTIAASDQLGLFDLRNYLRHYSKPGEEIPRIVHIGLCIAEQVLSEEIFRHLWQGEDQRTLRIQLPGAGDEANTLAALLARVPWEIARPAADKATLGERNLLVRVVHDMAEPPTRPLDSSTDDTLRVLFVFAEARGSNPLAMRKERLALRELFAKEIFPDRRIEAHFLTHGVTRERLRKQIQENNGYHVVHWSGHGHLNLLELHKTSEDEKDLTGDELLDLFTDAGGFLPRLFFLSACHSGDILRVKDWNDFAAIAAGKEPSAREVADTREISLEEQPGYTGTAHALLQGGVPSVVAMRYAVGDEYARDLAVEFYRALLAHKQPKDAAAALTMARKTLLTAKNQSRYAVCDHATPVLYGASQPGLRWERGRSPALDTNDPRLHQIAELTIAQHQHFVGRTWELAALGAEFIGSDQQPVAVITGLGGMGKTALTAETLDLWQKQFDWVLLYQAKPNALNFENTLRDIHIKLNGELGRYHDHVKARPADAIYRDATAEFTGEERYERLTRNLIRALRDEAILLVLDNFETNLKPHPEPGVSSPTVSEGYGVEASSSEAGVRSPTVSEGYSMEVSSSEAGVSSPTVSEGYSMKASDVAKGRTNEVALSDGRATDTEPIWACQDPAWERCLARMAEELKGTRSRVWVTCRRPLAALHGKAFVPVRLGPLPAPEAALYLREHDGLSRLFFSEDSAEKALAMRLLDASRFHPLLMDRLAQLAIGGAELRPQLLQALENLEQRKDFAQLPELFAAQRGNAQELAYLNDALAASLDQFIADASPDARRLLWMIAVANEPIELPLLESVWSGEDQEDEETQMLRQIKQVLEMKHLLPPEVLAEVEAQMTPEMQEILDNLPPPTTNHRPPTTNHLRYLRAVGLINEDDNAALSCHELVRERIRARMEAQPQERDGWTENSIRLGYADRLIAAFQAFKTENTTAALAVGSRALVYCVQAEAYDRLSGFASGVVISSNDPRLLGNLLPYLQAAAASAPAGRARWACLCYLADALRKGGRPDASLPFYEQAEAQARVAAGAAPSGSPDVRQAWSDVGTITGNWANALRDVGNLDAARQRQLESAEAKKNTGCPAVDIIASELEALRIQIMQGAVEQAWPQVVSRLATIKTWWRQHRAGSSVPEAPDPEFLARVYIGALDVATDAHYARKDWEAALPCFDATLEVERALQRPAEDLAATRFNRASVLGRLGRFSEAQAELEVCLQIFQHDPAKSASVLSNLADLFDNQGDVAEAIRQERRALALCEQLPDPRDRAISHNNLANYLERSGTPATLAEAPRHELAALIYKLVARLGQSMQTSLHNYALRFRRAHEAGTSYAVPRVADLLADPAFRPLETWLASRQVDVDELQAAVDQLLEQVRQQITD